MTKEYTGLRKWVREQYTNDELNDIATHGCCSGAAGLVYYKETNEIYDEYSGDIWELANDQAENFGHTNTLNMLASCIGTEHVSCDETFKNFMVWYVVEELAREILNDEGIDV